MTFEYRRRVFERHSDNESGTLAGRLDEINMKKTGGSNPAAHQNHFAFPTINSSKYRLGLAEMVARHYTESPEYSLKPDHATVPSQEIRVLERQVITSEPVLHTQIVCAGTLDAIAKVRTPLDQTAVIDSNLASELTNHPDHAPDIAQRLQNQETQRYSIGRAQVYIIRRAHQDLNPRFSEYLLTDGKEVVSLVLPTDYLRQILGTRPTNDEEPPSPSMYPNQPSCTPYSPSTAAHAPSPDSPSRADSTKRDARPGRPGMRGSDALE